MSRCKAENLKISVQNLDEWGQPASSKRDMSSTVVSFQFKNGNNWHMQLEKDMDERALYQLFRDVADLINRNKG